MEDYLKIYTIDELSDLKKGRGPDRQPRRRKHSGLTPYEEIKVGNRKKFHADYADWELANKVKKEREGAGLRVSRGLQARAGAKPVEKSLGDCYTIDDGKGEKMEDYLKIYTIDELFEKAQQKKFNLKKGGHDTKGYWMRKRSGNEGGRELTYRPSQVYSKPGESEESRKSRAEKMKAYDDEQRKKGPTTQADEKTKKEPDKVFVSGRGQFKPFQKRSITGKLFWVHPKPGGEK
jgi:hypothetical protein